MTIETEVAGLTQATTDLLSAVNVKKAALDAAEANAVNALDSFESQYIGARSSAPATDADGDPLQTGALYYNTTDTTMYVYSGSAWDALVDNLVVDPNATMSSNIATNGNDIKFGDNDKATFGASDDLQIFHDGNSWIKDIGSGNLVFDTNGNGMFFKHGDETLFEAYTNGAVNLKHNNSTKLATTATGANVTGTLTAGGLTLAGADKVQFGSSVSGLYRTNSGNDLTLQHWGGVTVLIDSDNNDLDLRSFVVGANSQDSGTAKKIAQFKEGGDISFYEDTGTTAKFVWDASAEKARFGGTTDDFCGSIGLDGNTFKIDGYLNNSVVINAKPNSHDEGVILQYNGNDGLILNNAGNVGIGTTSLTHTLHVTGATNEMGLFKRSVSGNSEVKIDTTLYGDAKLTFANNGTSAFTMGRDNSDSSFRIASGGTLGSNDRFVIDSSGNVGIGTASPISIGGHSGVLTLYGSNATALVLQDSTSRRDLRLDNGDLSFRNSSGNTHLMVKDDGKVGIGKSDPKGQLHVDGAEYSYFSSNVAGVTPNSVSHGIALGWNKSSGGGESVIAHNKGAGSSGGLVFANNNAGVYREDARIDISGNLLVGKTSASVSTAGAELRADGQISSTRSGDTPVFVNRLSNDGELIDLRKDGSTVGSIGVLSGYLTVGTGDTGLLFNDGANQIQPHNSTTNTSIDAAINIGSGSSRFKDLHLSGGVFLGGTGSANRLDDYEEGTWTPTITGSTGGTATVNAVTTSYTKIGNTVRVDCFLNQSDVTGLSGAVRISGLPFTGVGYSPAIVSYCNFFDFDERTDSVSGFTESGSAYANLTFGSASATIPATNATATSGTIMFHATYKTNQ